MKGARRASICSSMSFARKGIGDGGRDSVERSTQLLLLTWSGVDLGNGSTADQGRTGRKDSSSRLWCPARSRGTHAKQSPSTGHSAVGLRQVGNSLLTPRPHFTAPSCTLGNQVVGASDGGPYRQERRPTRVCRPPGAGSGLLAEASTLRAGTANIPPCRTLGRRTGLSAAVVSRLRAPCRLIEPSTTRGERVMRCPRAERGPSRDLDRGSEHATSDRSILEGCRRFIGCKSPVPAEK
jgi:hypothetical protein